MELNELIVQKYIYIYMYRKSGWKGRERGREKEADYNFERCWR